MIVYRECPLDPAGKVGFRLCADNATIVMLCDDCSFMWMHPDQVDPAHAIDPLLPDTKRHHPGISLQPSRWATEKEVADFGWALYLVPDLKVAQGYEEA